MKIKYLVVLLLPLIAIGCSKEERCRFLTSNAGLQCTSIGPSSKLDDQACEKAKSDAYEACSSELGSVGIEHYCTNMEKKDVRCPKNEHHWLLKAK